VAMSFTPVFLVMKAACHIISLVIDIMTVGSDLLGQITLTGIWQ